jgi:hypothetical protein
MNNLYTKSNQFPIPTRVKKGQAHRPSKMVSLVFEVCGVDKETLLTNTLWVTCNERRKELSRTNKYKHGKLLIK